MPCLTKLQCKCNSIVWWLIEAEALVAVRALEFAALVCPFGVVEGDLELVIKLFNDVLGMSKVGHLFDLARSMMGLFRNLYFTHVLCEGNEVAHV